MPFDGKLIPPDDAPLAANGEIDLPSDLTALAEQLRNDASRLASCYPSSAKSAAVAIGSPGPVFSSFWPVGAVALVLVSLLGAWSFWSPIAPRQDLLSRSESRQNRQLPPFTPSNSPPIGTAAANTYSFSELSGPELEALADLIEQAPNRENRIAF